MLWTPLATTIATLYTTWRWSTRRQYHIIMEVFSYAQRRPGKEEVSSTFHSKLTDDCHYSNQAQVHFLSQTKKGVVVTRGGCTLHSFFENYQQLPPTFWTMVENKGQVPSKTNKLASFELPVTCKKEEKNSQTGFKVCVNNIATILQLDSNQKALSSPLSTPPHECPCLYKWFMCLGKR